MMSKNDKVILAVALTALVISSTLFLIPDAKAEIILDNSSLTVLEDAESSCFEDSSEGLANMIMEIQPDSKCLGTFTNPPQYCQRFIRLRNPTSANFPITVQVIPIPDGLPCPQAPITKNKAIIYFEPSGDIDRTQYNELDLNDCWQWWCENTTYVTELRCPMGWNGLRYLGSLGGCYNVNVTIGNPMDRCPVASFTAQSDDIFVDIDMSWRADNDIDTPYIMKIKGYNTVYETDKLTTVENTTLYAGVDSYITGLETIVTVNMNLLTIIYMLFEIVVITIAIIGIPALVMLLIKWSWEAITSRPLGWGRNKK